MGPPPAPPLPVRADDAPLLPQERRRRRWPAVVVPLILVANVVLFAVTMYYNDCPKSSDSCVASFLGRFSFQPFKENPLLGPSSATLLKMGALDSTRVVQGNQGWRLISCIWLHAGLVHLVVNMFCLLIIGLQMEREFGFIKILAVYLVSGVGGSLLSALFIESTISVGASGALFGLLGSMLSELITNWSLYANKCSALFSLIFIIAINLALGILPHVDNFAHLGGFITGFLLGFVVLIRPQFGWTGERKPTPEAPMVTAPQPKHKPYQYILLILSSLIFVVGFIVAFVLLFKGYRPNDHCSWCHYLSCVPTKLWSCTSSVYCTAQQTGNNLTLVCQGLGRNQTYAMPNPTSAQINDLCTQLCS